MIKSPENLIEMKHSKPVRIVSMLIDYIDIVYLLEKLFNAIYVFLKKNRGNRIIFNISE
jgi:hypothetical protein